MSSRKGKASNNLEYEEDNSEADEKACPWLRTVKVDEMTNTPFMKPIDDVYFNKPVPEIEQMRNAERSLTTQVITSDKGLVKRCHFVYRPNTLFGKKINPRL